MKLFIFLLLLILIAGCEQKEERLFTIKGSSMEPTLMNGDKVSVDFEAYINRTVPRNDIVVIKFKTRDDALVKRVVAVPGDKATVVNNSIIINNKEIMFDKKLEKQFSLLKIQLERMNNTIPTNDYLVLGDNIGDSFDSGEFGIVSKRQIKGKVII